MVAVGMVAAGMVATGMVAARMVAAEMVAVAAVTEAVRAVVASALVVALVALVGLRTSMGIPIWPSSPRPSQQCTQLNSQSSGRLHPKRCC